MCNFLRCFDLGEYGLVAAIATTTATGLVAATATAATASATAAATGVTASATTTTAATTETTAAAGFAWLGFVDGEGAAVILLP
ncbi:MAG TPA: hypothetical protein VIM11_21880, partial [Tepidisphaeraceae bacterium]